MPKRDDEDLIRKHLWLSRQDWERTEMYFGRNMGTSRAIRVMMKQFLDGIEAKARQSATRPRVELELDEIPNDPA
jgi:hypothetical protein